MKNRVGSGRVRGVKKERERENKWEKNFLSTCWSLFYNTNKIRAFFLLFSLSLPFYDFSDNCAWMFTYSQTTIQIQTIGKVSSFSSNGKANLLSIVCVVCGYLNWCLLGFLVFWERFITFSSFLKYCKKFYLFPFSMQVSWTRTIE